MQFAFRDVPLVLCAHKGIHLRELATDPPWMKKTFLAMMSDLPFVAVLKVWSNKTGQPRVMVNGTQLEVHSWPDHKRLLMEGVFSFFQK